MPTGASVRKAKKRVSGSTLFSARCRGSGRFLYQGCKGVSPAASGRVPARSSDVARSPSQHVFDIRSARGRLPSATRFVSLPVASLVRKAVVQGEGEAVPKGRPRLPPGGRGSGGGPAVLVAAGLASVSSSIPSPVSRFRCGRCRSGPVSLSVPGSFPIPARSLLTPRR